jgi:hypothetical protein
MRSGIAKLPNEAPLREFLSYYIGNFYTRLRARVNAVDPKPKRVVRKR